jgi:uncharacterized protein (TIGR03083 family)
VSADGLAALRAERDDVLVLSAGLVAAEWAAPSDCIGWRVQDVVAHLANTCRAVADPGALAPGVPGDMEATQSVQAEAHRSWTPDQVLADYAQISDRAMSILEGFQGPPTVDTPIPIEDLGTYPLHLVADALAFDHFCHLRNDILGPNGPIDRPSPPADELRVGAAIGWLMAGLPQMSPALADVLSEPMGLSLTGAGGGDWTLTISDAGDIRVEIGGHPETSARSPATEFIIWGTRRRPWHRQHVELFGDLEYGASVLDAIHLF